MYIYIYIYIQKYKNMFCVVDFTHASFHSHLPFCFHSISVCHVWTHKVRLRLSLSTPSLHPSHNHLFMIICRIKTNKNEYIIIIILKCHRRGDRSPLHIMQTEAVEGATAGWISPQPSLWTMNYEHRSCHLENANWLCLRPT